MRKIAFLTVAAVTLGAATAQAGSLGEPCTSAPEAQWLPMQQLQAKVEAQGYKVRRPSSRTPAANSIRSTRTATGLNCSWTPTNGQIIGQM